MGLTVNFYTNNSENYRVDKSLTARLAESCILKDGTSVENPVILLTNYNDIHDFNYMYIDEWERYYFITDIVSVRNGLWEIHAHVDVLMSFSQQIRECTATCKRQENLFNMYLDDPEFKTYNKSQVVTKVFSGTGLQKNMDYVLVVAGG